MSLQKQIVKELNYIFFEGGEQRECNLKERLYSSSQSQVVEYAYSKILAAVAGAVGKRPIPPHSPEATAVANAIWSAGYTICLDDIGEMLRTQAEGKEAQDE